VTAGSDRTAGALGNCPVHLPAPQPYESFSDYLYISRALYKTP
jgi:hypothetical protein